MNNLIYSRNVLAIYFSSLTLPELVMENSVGRVGYWYFLIGDASRERGDIITMYEVGGRIHTYYVYGGSSGLNTLGKGIFTFVCDVRAGVWLI